MTTDIHSGVAVIVEAPSAADGVTAVAKEDPPKSDPPAPSVSERLGDAAKWVTVGFAAVTAGLAVAGASTSQLSRMASAFPRQVAWLFLVVVLALAVAGVAWALPGALAGLPAGSRTAGEESTVTSRRRFWLGAALVVVAWGSWAGLRVEGPVTMLLFPAALTVLVVVLLVVAKDALTNVAALLVAALLLFVSGVAGAVQLGVDALKFGTSASVSSSVAIEGQWATVTTAIKVTGLPVRGGARLFLVGTAGPGTVYGPAFVAADVAGTVDTSVALRVPATERELDVRLTPCTTGPATPDDPKAKPAPPPQERISCAATQASTATTYAHIVVAGDVPAASLAASVTPSADGRLMVLTVSGAGLSDVIRIGYALNSPGNEVTAIVRPDGNGAAEWKATVALPQRYVTLIATSGSASADASYAPFPLP